MKVTLDLDSLLAQGKITAEEHAKFNNFAVQTTSNLAFNILVGFGVVAVSGASLALIPSPVTAIIVGLMILLLGLGLSQSGLTQWSLLANMCILVGALMFGGGTLLFSRGSIGGLLLVTMLYSIAGIVARSGLLVTLAVLTLSAVIGARTGYMHAMYSLSITEPSLTIGIFGLLAIGLYQVSKFLPTDFERLAIIGARTSVFMVNFGFWIGSLWGDRGADLDKLIIIPAHLFVLGWAIALLATGIWAWHKNLRWLLNTVAVFGGIHFYTQWFEHWHLSPDSVLLAGILALGFAMALRWVNTVMLQKNS
jgi:hypothetical protein